MRILGIFLTAVLFFGTIPNAQAVELVGNITALDGRADILHDTSVISRKAREGSELVLKDVLRTKRSTTAKVDLVDGSSVEVYERSRLILHTIDRSVAGANAEVPAGKVRFSIDKKEDVSGDFSIKAHTAIIGVKGTEFLVHTAPGFVQVSVFEGLVSVGDIRFPDLQVDIAPGTTATVNRNNGAITVRVTPPEAITTDYSDDSSEDLSASSTTGDTNIREVVDVVDQVNVAVQSVAEGAAPMDAKVFFFFRRD